MKSESTEIQGLISESGKKRREATKRRKAFESISVSKQEAEDYVKAGWEFEKELKTKTKVRRLLTFDVRLENRVWLLFYLLGYHELNEKRTFTISVTRKDGVKSIKQIDLFAKDDETVVVAECKASDKVKKRSLQKDIEEFSNLKTYISKAIKEHYGPTFKPKIIPDYVRTAAMMQQIVIRYK